MTVRTPSRLHFSMVDMRGDLGRIHGSVGVAIDRPQIVLRAAPSDELVVTGPRAERVREYAETLLRASELELGAEIELVSDIPEHSGFGSGTQLALAVGAALSELHDLDLSPNDVALKLNRSRRSGIGTYAFMRGGFIVDGGHRVDKMESLPPLLFRSDVPEDWMFVIGLPEIAQKLSGDVENEAFKKLAPPPDLLVSQISRIILFQLMPAIVEGDIVNFGSAMTSIDYKFGEYWKDVQGGVFSHPLIETGVEFLHEMGAYGVGQSSWGPAFYGLVEGEDQAGKFTEKLYSHLNSGGRKGKAFVAAPNNEGATVTVEIQ
ncbi:MAG: kinase [Candidatus Bathyarchaeota archaeon]|nr:MAG: kinase [Candidatus Bathyarchaeota archaeon]